MLKRRIAGVALAAGLVLAAGPATGPARAAEQASIEPRAEQLLKGALSALAAAQSFTFRAEVTNEMPLPSGGKIQYAGTIETSVRRPDRLFYNRDSEEGRATGWYDGKTFTLLDREKKTCASWAVQEKLDALFGQMQEQLGFRPPLATLLGENVADESLKKVHTGFYAGTAAIRGVPCHHLVFRQENLDWEIWVAATGDPVIQRLVFTRKKDPTLPQNTVTFLDWDLKAKLDDSVFAYKSPEGVVQCEFQRVKK